MNENTLLRLEGLAVALVAVGIYSQYGASWWVFAIVFLLPDLGMLGYLASPRVGTWTYNLVHTYVTPLIFAGGAFAFRATAAEYASLIGSITLIWIAHIGTDRALGFGLKRASGFKETHLGRIGKG
ncbi:hypothetical protein CRI94_10585 [Longibacter salinarum]|uniref:DUF4260 domain-containing protein n=1 Tax=Longibacter salinarum TaxID=1850348 RepID=A0A2A8CWU7_9BACT|nr:DUF4260 domain-containing protein [Longibacter salinarum]PEN13091.1 hypothetical protein CRI94_10585 [Longibacter salinarum]